MHSEVPACIADSSWHPRLAYPGDRQRGQDADAAGVPEGRALRRAWDLWPSPVISKRGDPMKRRSPGLL